MQSAVSEILKTLNALQHPRTHCSWYALRGATRLLRRPAETPSTIMLSDDPDEREQGTAAELSSGLNTCIPDTPRTAVSRGLIVQRTMKRVGSDPEADKRGMRRNGPDPVNVFFEFPFSEPFRF
ncbi:hypothetical protein PHSY_000879 [Pseudozyma hubeiensis SY62]|uniref:Uncharacterized protein n=1 Tax=Pseudozyma hubeiensis (strain SY62) TaxID=1305764 RepID=R9NXH8_PSEHS|nr:hypothetical protein PHSY_000879 [Pseudozyma hubeiensis SY62]GAC93314.1 hypothetical protein PHSY_000879 [Pseudozyma hubeiensis SY62]